MNKPKPSFTIFTATYNRIHTLPRLYESIKRQTERDFEWIIVDDGSSDGTEHIVQKWQDEGNDFPIRYFWQTNQHKKVAFNRGVREASGKWFVAIDSDDELLPDTLSNFRRAWLSIPKSERLKIVAVVGLCLDDDGKLVGDRFPNDPFDASSVELFFDYKIRGEKFSCQKTEILREYPFPEEIPDLVPENVVWFRLAKNFTQRCFNMPVRIYHRDVESITKPFDASLARHRRAEGALLSYAESLNWVTWRRFRHSPLRVIFLAVQYGRWYSYLPVMRRKYKPVGFGPRFLIFAFRPVGWLLYVADKLRLTERLRDGFARLGLWI